MYIALIECVENMPMGSSRVGGPATQKGATKGVEDPRAETSDFRGSTPDVISYNKGQCTELWLKAVWARVIARRRLVREVGSEEKKEEGCQRQQH